MVLTYHSPVLPGKYIKIHKALQEKGIVGEYKRRFIFPDEPHFFQYACERHSTSRNIKKELGFGCSEDEGEAFIAAVAEAIEQYCILQERDDLFIRDSYEKLAPDAVDPQRLIPFSSDQLAQPKYKKFRVTTKSQLNWLEGYSATRKRRVLVPASVVYANYDAKARNEPTIQFKNSTGAAFGPTWEFAVYRGLCEVIERDAYMISFLGKVPPRRVDLDGDADLAHFIRRIGRYDLEVHVLDTSIDRSVFTAACILLDRTGSGPAVCTGLGGRISPEEAIKAAVFEAIRLHNSARGWIFRPKPFPMPPKFSFDWFLRQKQIVWSAPHMIHVAQKYLTGKHISYRKILQEKKKLLSKLPTNKDKVQYLVEELRRLHCEVLCVDVTTPEVRELGLFVVKILVPEMVPLWRDGRYPYLGTKRILNAAGGAEPLMPKVTREHALTIHPF